MKIKTKYLTGAALDWAVAMLQGYDTAFASAGDVIILREGVTDYFDPHRNWGWGGPIIDELIQQGFTHEKADFGMGIKFWRVVDGEPQFAHGPTTLIAAMRCYCSFKLGNEVDVPEELLK